MTRWGESDWLGARTVELSPLSLGADRSKVAEQLVATKIIELVVMGITNKRIRVDRAKYSYVVHVRNVPSKVPSYESTFVLLKAYTQRCTRTVQ